MKNLTEKIGTLIERVAGGSELRLQIKVGEYVWHMYSDKTGHHSVIQPKENGTGKPTPSKRVRLHWDRFLQNQTK